MAVPYTFSAGTLAKSSEVNENFAYVNTLPIKSIVSWVKHFSPVESGTNTTDTANKLIDSAATFSTNGVIANDVVYLTYFYEGTETSTLENAYTLVKTITFDAGGTDGLLVSYVQNSIKQAGAQITNCKMKYYYTDATTAESDVQTTTSNAYVIKLYNNPSISKLVYKIEVYAQDPGGYEVSYQDEHYVYFYNEQANVVSVDSQTQLTLDSDLCVGTGLSYVIERDGLHENWVECNGQVLSDADSSLNGKTIPNLNGAFKMFLRGNLISGSTGILAATGTADISYYEVVYIMRVK